jgi:hypothetical protein
VSELLETNRTLATALEKEIASGTRSFDLTQSDLGIYCPGRVGHREKLLSPELLQAI